MRLLITHSPHSTHLLCPLNLFLTPTRHEDPTPLRDRELQHIQRHAAADARNEDVAALHGIVALDHQRPPRRQARQRQRRRLRVRQVLRRLLDLVLRHAQHLLRRARGQQRRAAQDRVAGRRVGALARRRPAAPRREDHALAPPAGGRGGADRGGDDAAAVGEEGDGEPDAWVQVLAEEVVAVVEGAGADLDREVVGAGRRGWHCVEGEAGKKLLARL